MNKLTPQQAFLYFPKEQVFHIGNFQARFIFEGQVQYSQKENENLQNFEKYLNERNLSLGNYTNADQLRMLLANKYDFKKTYQGILIHQQFLNQIQKSYQNEKMNKILNSKFISFTGFDMHFRPLLLLQIKHLDFSNQQVLDDQQDALCYFMQFLIDNVFLKGQVENWVMIMDLNKQSILDLPLNNIKKILVKVSGIFRNRAYKIYVINSPSSIMMAWKILQTALDDITKSKVMFSKTYYHENMFKHINKKQMTKNYGGLRENITDDQELWPIQFQNYEQDIVMNDGRYLITEKEYNKLYKDGKLQNNIINYNFIEAKKENPINQEKNQQIIQTDNKEQKQSIVNEKLQNEVIQQNENGVQILKENDAQQKKDEVIQQKENDLQQKENGIQQKEDKNQQKENDVQLKEDEVIKENKAQQKENGVQQIENNNNINNDQQIIQGLKQQYDPNDIDHLANFDLDEIDEGKDEIIQQIQTYQTLSQYN